MTVEELKNYIYKNNKIEFILEDIGCHSIKYHPNKEYYSCGNYNGDNKAAINIKNNQYLNCINHTRKKEFNDRADLISLVQYNKSLLFSDSIKYLHTVLGLKFTYKQEEKKEKIDPLNVFKRVKTRKRRVDINEIEILDEEILNDFVPYIHIDWYREGVVPRTIKIFQLGYSYRRCRVIIPIRYWLTGELIGIVGRTMIDNYEMFDIPKYLAIKPYVKTINLYGLYENYKSIQSNGYCVVLESEKSVLKRHSRLDETCVAVGCHEISDEQVRILIGLNTEIVIAFDKDVEIEHIRHCCEKFYRIRKVSYIYDKWGIIDKKDSPADANNKIYQFMFKHRVVYNEDEHIKYLKSLERKM